MNWWRKHSLPVIYSHPHETSTCHKMYNSRVAREYSPSIRSKMGLETLGPIEENKSMKNEDKRTLENLLSRQALSDVTTSPSAYFRTLVDDTSIPQRFKNEIAGSFTAIGNVQIAA